MFEKLLATLPYNPSMVHQLAFYSRRMREESSVRRTGLILLVLAFLIQFFAVISPPQPTVADSTNDLINGGITSAADANRNCRYNVNHYKDIMDHYGITCDEIAGADKITLQVEQTETIGGRTLPLYSMGHKSYGATNPTTGEITGEVSAGVPETQVYWRLLKSFSSYDRQYDALRFRSAATGKQFFILFTCGNLVTFGVPPAYKPPKIDIPKTTTEQPKKCPYDSTLTADDKKCVPCQYNNSILASDISCKPCTSSVSSADILACVKTSKSAANITQGLADANGKLAHGGDTITYTLYAQNNGKATVKGFVFQDDISDILDYADVVNPDGGKLNDQGLIVWPAEDIKPGVTTTVQFSVKIKNPIPSTPVSASDPGRFDLIMTNVFTNTINIPLPPTPTKTVETAAAKLPNTGPGTSLFIGAAIVISAGYFYSRSRLLATESMIAIHDNTSGGL